MRKTVNKVISGITCILYAWLYGVAVYFASETFFLNRVTWDVERPFLSERAEDFLDIFFLNNSDIEGNIINIILAVLAIFIVKTLVCAFQKELSKESKVRILSLNFLYLFLIFLFVFFSGDKTVGAVMAVICAVCLVPAFLVNIKTDVGKERKSDRLGCVSKALCIISAVVYILFGIYFIMITAENSGIIKFDMFLDYYLIVFGVLVLYTLIRAIYLAVNKSLPSVYKARTLVGAGLILPASILAMRDGGSMVIYFIRAALFLAAIVFTLYTHFEFIIRKNDDNIEDEKITY